MYIIYKYVLCSYIVIIIYHNIPIILTRSIYSVHAIAAIGPSLKRDRFESHRQLYSRRTLLFRRWFDDIYFFLNQKIIIITFNTVYILNCGLQYMSYCSRFQIFVAFETIYFSHATHYIILYYKNFPVRCRRDHRYDYNL